MGATFGGVDRVREGVDRFGVGGVPLHRDFDAHGLVFGFGAEVDDRRIRHTLRSVDMPDEVGDAALIVVGDRTNDFLTVIGGNGFTFIDQGDGQTLIEEGHLLEPAGQGGEVVDRGFEDLGIGPEGDRGSGDGGLLPLLQRGRRYPTVIGLAIDRTIAVHFDFEV